MEAIKKQNNYTLANTWITDYNIGKNRYWKCGFCQNLILVSENGMNYCGHCGEPKCYTTTEKRLSELRKLNIIY